MATGTVVVTDRNVAQMRQDLAKLLSELEAGQKEMEQGPISQARGEELDRKASEALALQEAIEKYEQRQQLIARGREVVSPTLPARNAERKSGRKVVVTPGHLFVLSEAYRRYRQQGKADTSWSARVDVRNLSGAPVVLYGEEAEQFLKAAHEAIERKQFDPSQLPDIGDDSAVPIQRDPEWVRSEERKPLTIRQLLRVMPTSSDTVAYVRYEYTDAAAAQSGRGGTKPYAGIKTERVTTPVQTIAVLHKVAEQDIEDAPRLIDVINLELRQDVLAEEERQILWGSGASGELEGLFTAGIPEFTRAQAGDTLIDLIRRMRTDVVMAGLTPTAVAVHPLDWEQIELEKGTDNRYVWAVVRTELGPQIWSLPVVESQSLEDPTTGERRMIVADWLRGATIYDRHDVRLAVGYVNDDFERNLRTIRAEERLALGLKRPAAFSWATVFENGENGG